MTKGIVRIAKVSRVISESLVDLEFQEIADSEMESGVPCKLYSMNHGRGQVRFAFSVVFSNNKAIFVVAKIGISVPELGSLYDLLEIGNPARIAYPHAMLAWSVGENSNPFDPSPFNPGNHFSFPEQGREAEIAVLRSRIPEWVNRASKYLTFQPFFEFYRFDSCIDKNYRWRELIAILKLLRGEEYVGMQLLNDLVDESSGRRALFGEYDMPMFKILGLRKDEAELSFRENLRKNVQIAIKAGVFRDLSSRFEDQPEYNGRYYQ